MPLNSLFHSTGVKLAAACSALFCVATLITATVAYFLIADDLTAWLDRELSETSSYLVAEFKEGGEKALAESVEQHAAASEGNNEIFLLIDRDGKKSAGNAEKFNTALGWHDATPEEFGLQGKRGFRVLSQSVGNSTLIVARSDTAIDEIGDIIEKAFSVGAVIMAISALLAGLLIGLRTQRRIEEFQTTLDAVSRGEMNQRIDVPPKGGDDIDRIGRKLNKTLDHLKSAILSMQHVTVDIAHDLKSPIARLRNKLADIEVKLNTDDEARLEVQGAIDEADNIAQTFDSILRISQIESGERRKHFSQIDLRHVVMRAAEIFGAVVEDRGGALSSKVSDTPMLILGDERLVLQLIANVIENSIRHTIGTPLISLSAAIVNERLSVVIADNGPGIPESERENVKQRFYRLDKSRSTKGSGLGLALVTAIADLHTATLTLGDNHPGLRVEITFTALETA